MGWHTENATAHVMGGKACLDPVTVKAVCAETLCASPLAMALVAPGIWHEDQWSAECWLTGGVVAIGVLVFILRRTCWRWGKAESVAACLLAWCVAADWTQEVERP